ncbi:MAG TPA: zinc-binding alcohol dehydrogenase, partial [Acidimicrobiales bacterium]|nr:zinc-binding alcohol dehydrogenase [Acidimicrobiales bacterium]
MRQVVQPLSGGAVEVLEVPRPSIDGTEVLVRTVASVISSGTERALTSLAQSSLLAKARARPDLVRQVIRKAKAEGVVQASRAVRSRLESDLPLGYSAAGVVVEVGRHVSGLVPGQMVATAGAGKANHAEYQAVPGLLCAVVPAGVEAEEAAFATIASIALHGLRLAELGPGAKIVVLGLGLVGQLAVRLAQASGLDVAGIDVAEHPLSLARGSGALALAERGSETTDAVLEWSRGRGADAVLVCAASSSSDLVARTPALARDRAPVVIVGDVGVHLERTPFYEKELSLRFARSYGPGRYERAYEEWGIDYPAGQVRWTEGRNLEAVLDLLASRRLAVADLITHRFPIEKAPDAYELIERREEPCVGVVLTYSGADEASAGAPVRLRAPAGGGATGVGLVGAGAFASTVLVPGLKAAGFERFVA